MTCPFCGKADNPASAKFCSHCGTALLGNFDERISGAGQPVVAAVDPPPVPSPVPEPPPAVTPEMFFPWRKPEPRPEPTVEPSTPVAPIAVAEPDGERVLAAPARRVDPGERGDAAAAEGQTAVGSRDEMDDGALPGGPGHGAGSGTPRREDGPEVAAPIAAATDAGPWFERHGASGVAEEAPSKQSRYWATGAHASAFVGAWMGGVPAFIGPLIVWLARKDDDPFAAEHGRNALNFNLSVIVYVLAMVVFSIFTFGIGLLVTIPGLILLGLAWFALTLVGTIKAASSETYRYPLTIRFVR